MRRSFGLSTVLLVLAIIVFVLAGLGVTLGDLEELDMIAFGLALGFGSFLAP